PRAPKKWERVKGFEPRRTAYRSGHRDSWVRYGQFVLERAMGFEPTTLTLARLCSTPELHPRSSGALAMAWHDATARLYAQSTMALQANCARSARWATWGCICG